VVAVFKVRFALFVVIAGVDIDATLTRVLFAKKVILIVLLPAALVIS
jgi:hypothetical protein